MGWDKGRYYTRSHKINGRVVREYFGAGAVGELAAREDAARRASALEAKEAWRRRRAEVEEVEARLAEVDGLADLVARAAMAAAGYFQHQRGPWRKRLVVAEQKVSDEWLSEVAKLEGLKGTVDDLRAGGEAYECLFGILKRAQAGDEKTAGVVRAFLISGPVSVDACGGNPAMRVQKRLIALMSQKNILFREALTRKLDMLREELCGPKPTTVERLLVERVVACWIQVEFSEWIEATTENIPFRQAEFNLRQVDHAHRRYLSALKALATVRKLALPVLVQVNVAKAEPPKAEPPKEPLPRTRRPRLEKRDRFARIGESKN